MPALLHNVTAQNIAATLSADVTLDLPVNPLMCIYYTLRAEQLAISDTADKTIALANLLATVSKIEVLYRGSAILSGSLTDLAILSGIITGRMPFISHAGDATNNAVQVTIPLYLGRPKMRGAECFPATRRGELTLHRVFAATSTNIVTTTITEQIETLELLDAAPATFLKAITLKKTWLATGDNDMDMPLGNPIAGILLFGTTAAAATASAATWNKTKLLVDNVEFAYALTNWETLNGSLHYKLDRNSEGLQVHTHSENLAASYAAVVATARPRLTESLLDNYGYLDLDPFGDDAYLLATAGRGRVHLRTDAGTADAARAIPLEVLKTAAA